jgi:hypothetical protein
MGRMQRTISLFWGRKIAILREKECYFEGETTLKYRGGLAKEIARFCLQNREVLPSLKIARVSTQNSEVYPPFPL